MKDKRTAEEKASHESYLKEMAKTGAVGCSHTVKICPPGDDTPLGDEERCWTLMIEQKGGHGFRADIVIAWHKTRETARQHAKRLRKALTQLVVNS